MGNSALIFAVAPLPRRCSVNCACIMGSCLGCVSCMSTRSSTWPWRSWACRSGAVEPHQSHLLHNRSGTAWDELGLDALALDDHTKVPNFRRPSPSTAPTNSRCALSPSYVKLTSICNRCSCSASLPMYSCNPSNLRALAQERKEPRHSPATCMSSRSQDLLQEAGRCAMYLWVRVLLQATRHHVVLLRGTGGLPLGRAGQLPSGPGPMTAVGAAVGWDLGSRPRWVNGSAHHMRFCWCSLPSAWHSCCCC